MKSNVWATCTKLDYLSQDTGKPPKIRKWIK